MSETLHDNAKRIDRPRKVRTTFWLVMIVCLATSCAPYQSAHRTLYRNLSEYPPVHDAKESCAVYRSWAESEWAQVRHVAPKKNGRVYRRGFIDGFVDAVYAGGNGEPPVVPPRPYWRIWFRNAAGDDEIATWTDGFRHGARTALDGGYRERAVIPTTMRLSPEPSMVANEGVSVYSSPSRVAPNPTPAEEIAPPPPSPEGTVEPPRPQIEPEESLPPKNDVTLSVH